MTVPVRTLRRHLVTIVLVVAAGMGTGGVPEGAGQSASDLEAWELRYRSAEAAHEAAAAALAAARNAFDNAIAAGDRALANEQSRQLQTLQRRFTQTAGDLAAARDSLIAAVDRRLEHLVNVEIARARTAVERAGVLSLARDLEFRLDELERIPPIDTARVADFAHPVTFDTRDTPAELRRKAALLELRVENADRFIEQIDERIGVLEGRQRRNAALNDFQANLGRFGDTRARVGAADRGVPSRDPAGGSDPAGSDPRTPQDEIEDLRSLRAKVIELRDADRQRALEFRRLAAGRSG